jgi:anti-sigma factor RsiW
MKPVLPEELSALMDGELDADRAREIETQLAANPHLRAEFSRLVETDAQWRAAAATAVFAPAVRLPPTTAGLRSAAIVTALMIGLICLRMAPRWLESLTLVFGLHTVALAVLLAGLMKVARADDSERDAHA